MLYADAMLLFVAELEQLLGRIPVVGKAKLTIATEFVGDVVVGVIEGAVAEEVVFVSVDGVVGDCSGSLLTLVAYFN